MLKRPLNHAERWFHDGITVSQPPAFVEILEIDMSQARAAIECGRAQGLRWTYLHILVWAAARILTTDGRLHQLLCGTTLVQPECPDIAVSIAGETCLSPVLIIEAAHRKSLSAIANELRSRVAEAQRADRDLIRNLNRFGWIVPIGIFRRAVLRLLRRSAQFRRKGSGTFQISILQDIDVCFTPIFGNTAILTAGRVRDRVIAVDGNPAVRPTMLAACSADHRICDGKACQEFLIALRDLLEAPDLTLRVGPTPTVDTQHAGL